MSGVLMRTFGKNLYEREHPDCMAPGGVESMEERELSCPFQKAFGPGICGMHRRLHEMMAAPGQRVMPVIRGAGIPVDIRNLEDEVEVVADLPGVESSDVAIRLTGPMTLRITVRRMEEEREGYAVRERLSGEMTRVVNLPATVTEEAASASLRNGVLAVRLRKAPGQGVEIPVREG
ncbi:Hsp20/alpha crystallin family protein [anaerobic digester metagenome]